VSEHADEDREEKIKAKLQIEHAWPLGNIKRPSL
jgi:hypothetical protein